jgi:hypothetical protein
LYLFLFSRRFVPSLKKTQDTVPCLMLITWDNAVRLTVTNSLPFMEPNCSIALQNIPWSITRSSSVFYDSNSCKLRTSETILIRKWNISQFLNKAP